MRLKEGSDMTGASAVLEAGHIQHMRFNRLPTMNALKQAGRGLHDQFNNKASDH
jgi:hypothetical protein